MPYEIILFLFILGMAALLIYLSSTRRKKIENFISSVSSYSLYMDNSSTDFDKQMKTFKDTISDSKSLLHVYGCGIALGKSPNALREYVDTIADGLYIIPLEDSAMYTNHIESVTELIQRKIDIFYQNVTKGTIKGQIYVLLSQAPYYRDADNIPISLQYTATQYGYMPTNVMKDDINVIKPDIKLHGYMIFTAYDKNGTFIVSSEEREKMVRNIKKNCRQKQDLCFMRCPQSLNMPCGCASQDVDDVKNIPYLSTCLDSGRPTKMSEGHPYTYAILYRVNPKFGNLLISKKMEADYTDLDWSPSQINDVPVVGKPIPPPEPITYKNSITIYQHCNYQGFISEPIPVGKYTIDHIKKYFGNNATLDTDVSAFKTNGNVKVKMYKGTVENPIPIDVGTKDGYINKSVPCFTKYLGLNDNLVYFEVAKDKRNRWF